MDAPTTLQQAVIYFSDADRCAEYMIAERWPDGQVRCPQCDSTNVKYLPNAKLWKCYEKHPRQKFSLKVGTIFEDSPLPLQKWLPAVWLITNAKNGISSYELHRALGVTQKTAWFMLSRIRLAMQTKSFTKIGGEAEIDETYIGGKARNMHATKRKRIGMSQSNSMIGKAAVMGLLERHGAKGHSTIRLEVVAGRKRSHFGPVVEQHIEKGTTINTDAHLSYQGLGKDYVHNVIDHAEKYVNGQIHTNGCENFWSLLKRALKGTYVSVEPFHLFRYLDEQAFRFNNRKTTDAERFRGVLGQVTGRRVTYKDLIGKANAEA
jgi:transposase-like protein